jgi:hypothetical protein
MRCAPSIQPDTSSLPTDGTDHSFRHRDRTPSDGGTVTTPKRLARPISTRDPLQGDATASVEAPVTSVRSDIRALSRRRIALVVLALILGLGFAYPGSGLLLGWSSAVDGHPAQVSLGAPARWSAERCSSRSRRSKPGVSPRTPAGRVPTSGAVSGWQARRGSAESMRCAPSIRPATSSPSTDGSGRSLRHRDRTAYRTTAHPDLESPCPPPSGLPAPPAPSTC